MNKKYILALGNDRKIGPFSKEQIGVLYLKGQIKGTEKCQIFPDATWIELGKIKEIVDLIKEIISEKLKEDDLAVPDADLTAVKLSFSSLKKETLKERESIDEEKKIIDEKRKLDEMFAHVNLDQFKVKDKIEKRYQDKINRDDKDEIKDGEEKETLKNDEENDSLDDDHDDSILEKTMVNPIPWPEVSAEASDELTLEKSVIEQETPEVHEITAVSSQDATEMVDLQQMLPEIHYKSQETEDNLKNQEAEVRAGKKIERAKIRSEIKKLNEVKQVVVKPKKKMSLVVVLAFIVIIFSVLDEDGEDKKKIIPQYAKLSFPVPDSFKNEEKSNEYLKKGKQILSEKTYLKKIEAAKYFKKAIFHNIKNSEAAGLLILVYAEIFDNVISKPKAISTLYRLIKHSEKRILKDPNVALGAALFYLKNEKLKTARKIIENYVGASKKPTLKMYSVYLNILVRLGKWELAEGIYNKIKDQKNPPIELYVYIADYLIRKPDNFEKEEKRNMVYTLLKKGFKLNSNSVWLLTELAPFSLQSRKFKEFKKIIQQIKELKAEQAPSFYSKYLEFKGMAYAYNQEAGKAVKYFQEALRVFPSSELRSRLAKLEVGGSKQVEGLILESKIIKLMEEVKVLLRKNMLDQAFFKMIDAVDLDDSYIPAKILLAKIEISRGFFTSALKTLEELRDDYPDSYKINYELLLAYIDSYKLDMAKKYIDHVSNTKFSSSAYYAAILGRYYLKTGRLTEAFSWLFKSIVRNPLDDEGYYILARQYFKFRKFNKAKENLLMAIDLAPDNLDYKSLYADILYEISGTEVAIGYLRDQLKHSPKSAKILGDIAIYYYRSGQIKEFEAYKSELASLNTSDKDFYKFLISSSQMEDDVDSVIKYSQALIKISPGDIGSRMILGRYFLERNKILAAENLFKEVVKRLPSYPKVNFYLAKINIYKKNYEEAHKYATDEINYNKTLEFGPYIKGEIYRLEKNYVNAIKQYELSLSIKSNYIDALNALAFVKKGQHYLDTARELYLRVLKEDQGNIVANRNLAHVYREIGQSALALEQYKVYLKLSPKGKDVARIKQIMRGLK